MCIDRGVHIGLLFNFSTKETLTPWFHRADICYLLCALLFCSVFHKKLISHRGCFRSGASWLPDAVDLCRSCLFPFVFSIPTGLTMLHRLIISLFVRLLCLLLIFLTLWCSRVRVGTPCYILKIVCWPLHCMTSCLTRSALCWLTQQYSPQSRAEQRACSWMLLRCAVAQPVETQSLSRGLRSSTPSHGCDDLGRIWGNCIIGTVAIIVLVQTGFATHVCNKCVYHSNKLHSNK